MKTVKCERCGKPLSTYGCVNSSCPEYYGIKEVPMEFIEKMIEDHAENHYLKRDQNLYICKDEDRWAACDNTSGDCFIESFKSRERAERYLMGESPEELYEEEQEDENAYNVK